MLFPWEIALSSGTRRPLPYAPETESGFDFSAVEIDGRAVPVQEQVVARQPFYRLIHFEREIDRTDPRLVAVAPLSGHHAALMRDLLAALLPDHDLFLMDWANARDVPVSAGRFALEDNISSVIDVLRSFGGDVHLLGLCQSAIPVLAAAGVLASRDEPAQPRSLVLISGAIDPRINPTRVGQLAAQRSLDWFERHIILTVPDPYPGKGRRVYPASAQREALFAYFLRHMAMGGELSAKVLLDDGLNAQRFPFIDLFFSVMDLTAEFFLDTVRFVFQEFALPRGRLTWRGSRVDLGAISRSALMTVEGEFDDVSGRGQTHVAHDLCPNIPRHKRERYLQRAVGHFGTFYGRPWRNEIMPRIRQFVRDAG